MLCIEGDLSPAAIMMVTYNRLELTKQTLGNLFKTTDYPFYLIIVDNGSTDGTVEYLDKFLEKKPTDNEFLQQIIVRKNKTNRGIATGRNQALLEADKLSDTLWYSTLDNDVLLPNGWLSECIDVLMKNKNYGGTGVNFESTEYPLITLNGKIVQDKKQGNLGTACTVFPKSIHKIIGFFNTKDYSPNYGLEDSDAFFRVRVAGFKLCYIQTPGVHIGEDSGDTSEYRKMKTFEHDRYKELFQKNCALYYQGKKSIYVSFSEKEIDD